MENKINNFKLEVNLDRPGILVLSENYYPAWKAYVNGKPAQIYRANYLFRAVYLDEGRHSIDFVFDSVYYNIGKYSTLFSFVFCGLILVVYLGRGFIKTKKEW